MSPTTAIVAALFGAFCINVIARGELSTYLGFFGVGGNSANPAQAGATAAGGSSSGGGTGSLVSGAGSLLKAGSTIAGNVSSDGGDAFSGGGTDGGDF